MKLSQLIELLQEYERSTFTRPDTTGIRGKGTDRQPDRRLANFPYDTDVSYGSPQVYDRGSNGADDRGSNGADTLNHPLTPHDDAGFSLRLLGIEDPAEIPEAIGTPSLFAKGNSSQRGGSIPGVGNGWANNPPKDWERSQMDDQDEVVNPLTGPLTIDPAPPDIETPPSPEAPNFRTTTDDDLENRLNRIWGDDSNMNFVDPAGFGSHDAHQIAPDPWTAINQYLTSRGLYGRMPNESAWDRVSGMVQKKTRENF